MLSYDEYKEIIESNLLNYIPEVDSKAHTIYDAMKYSVMNGGKRLRPVLLLAACDFAGGDINEALTYACALEYIHTYSLIHDDLPAMDNDDLRRGNPTNHKVFGEAIAILAGDGLLNTACEAMLRDLTYYFDDDRKLKNHIRAQFEIVKAAGVNGMIAGQISDIENEFKECSYEMVEFIDKNKTGALLRASILAGLSIAGADKNMVSDFRLYAESIGSAFQISDDILDFTSTPEELGKTPGKDKEQGKSNYVLVNGMYSATEELHRLTIEAVSCLKKYGESAEFFIELAEKLEKRKS